MAATTKKVRIDLVSDIEKKLKKFQELDKILLRLEKRKIKLQLSLENFEKIEKQIDHLRKEQIKLSVELNADEVATNVKKITSILEPLADKEIPINVDADVAKKMVDTLSDMIIGLEKQGETTEIPVNVEASQAKSDVALLEKAVSNLTAEPQSLRVELEKKDFLNNLMSLNDKVSKVFGNIGRLMGVGGSMYMGMRAIRSITSQVQRAFERFDLRNNFVVVMENLGHSAEEAARANERLMEGLEGLPTALDAGVAGVQQLVAVTGDVEQATEAFLGLNNAIIAGGAPVERQGEAVRQLIAMISSGEPVMQRWSTLLEVMPAQMQMIAQSMGYMNAEELRQSIMMGTSSMEDMMDEIVRLNLEGGENFASFEKQARDASDGVQTGIANSRIAIQRGIEGILTALDNMFRENPFQGIRGEIDSLATMITEIGRTTESILGSLAGAIDAHGSRIVAAFSRVIEAVQRFDFEGLFNGVAIGIGIVLDAGSRFVVFALEAVRVLADIAEILPFVDDGMAVIGATLVGLHVGMKLLAKYTAAAAFAMEKKGLAIKKTGLLRGLMQLGGVTGKKGMLAGLKGSLMAMPVAWKVAFGVAIVGAIGLVARSIREGSEASQEFRANLDKLGERMVSHGENIQGIVSEYETWRAQQELIAGDHNLSDLLADLIPSIDAYRDNLGNAIEANEYLRNSFSGMSDVGIEYIAAAVDDMNRALGETVLVIDEFGNLNMELSQLDLEFIDLPRLEGEVDKFGRLKDRMGSEITDLVVVIDSSMREIDAIMSYYGITEAFEEMGFDIASMSIEEFVSTAQNARDEFERVADAIGFSAVNMAVDMHYVPESFDAIGEAIDNMAQNSRESFFEMIDNLAHHIEKVEYARERYGYFSEEYARASQEMEYASQQLMISFAETASELENLTYEGAKRWAELTDSITELTRTAVMSAADYMQLYTYNAEGIAERMEVTRYNINEVWEGMLTDLSASIEAQQDRWLFLEEIAATHGREVAVAVEGMENDVITALMSAYDSHELIADLAELLDYYTEKGADMVVGNAETLGVEFVEVMEETFDPDSAYDLGHGYMEGMIDGFSGQTPLLIDAAQEAADGVSDLFPKAWDFGSPSRLAEGYGRKFMQGLINGIESLEGALMATMQRIASGVAAAAANISTSVNSAAASASRAQSFSSGGPVQYRASGGGIDFKPHGTDTVPAMLTPGEFVHRKSAVKYFGDAVMRRMNNMDLHGTFDALTKRFGVQTGQTQSVTNNYYTNNYDNKKITITAPTSLASDLAWKAGRYV